MIERASLETNAKKRMQEVHAIDIKLQMDPARPILAPRLDCFATWPYVKTLVAHNSIYNYWRLQEVWLDK